LLGRLRKKLKDKISKLEIKDMNKKIVRKVKAKLQNKTLSVQKTKLSVQKPECSKPTPEHSKIKPWAFKKNY